MFLHFFVCFANFFLKQFFSWWCLIVWLSWKSLFNLRQLFAESVTNRKLIELLISSAHLFFRPSHNFHVMQNYWFDFFSPLLPPFQVCTTISTNTASGHRWSPPLQPCRRWRWWNLPRKKRPRQRTVCTDRAAKSKGKYDLVFFLLVFSLEIESDVRKNRLTEGKFFGLLNFLSLKCELFWWSNFCQ